MSGGGGGGGCCMPGPMSLPGDEYAWSHIPSGTWVCLVQGPLWGVYQGKGGVSISGERRGTGWVYQGVGMHTHPPPPDMRPGSFGKGAVRILLKCFLVRCIISPITVKCSYSQ